jgi:hypothetical protein
MAFGQCHNQCQGKLATNTNKNIMEHDSSGEPGIMGASFSMTPERLREALSAGNNGGGISNDSDLESGASGYSFGRAEMQEESYFKNMTDDPTKAVLFFYLNSGLFRFEQHRDHTTSDDLKRVNLEQLKMDIEGEMLTPLEYNDVVRRFYSQHPFMDFTSKSCTAVSPATAASA